MLSKAACFTDIHWGRKNNSELHNQDCIRFIKWFCKQVKDDDSIDHVIFLGDWFEHRSAINGLTLEYAYRGAKMLADLGLPVYFIVGNHDLYYRTTREVYSTNFFNSLGFNIIGKPTVVEEIGRKGTLLCPFLFENEYGSLAEYFKVPVWFGHFEFKGFILTGSTRLKEHGPDPKDFRKPVRIFSGHFHKRQTNRNITYIGSTFPADFSDANDIERGMMIYEHGLDDIEFINWDKCPSYIRINLSELVKTAKKVLRKGSTVNCIVDIDITYEESLELKKTLTKKYGLREINLHENPDQLVALQDTTDELVKSMLKRIEVDTIKNDTLIEIYEGL